MERGPAGKPPREVEVGDHPSMTEDVGLGL